MSAIRILEVTGLVAALVMGVAVAAWLRQRLMKDRSAWVFLEGRTAAQLFTALLEGDEGATEAKELRGLQAFWEEEDL